MRAMRAFACTLLLVSGCSSGREGVDATTDAISTGSDARDTATDARDATPLDARDALALDVPQSTDAPGVDPDGGTCTAGSTRPCYTGAEGREKAGPCHGGTNACVVLDAGTGLFSTTCTGEVVPAMQEICGNGIDDDCNGIVDDGCGTTSGCGNHVCDNGENCGTCPVDCGDCTTVCGHQSTCGGCAGTAGCGWCGASSSCIPCLGSACTPATSCASGWAPNVPNCPAGCGDGVCNNGENCGTCPADCGTCTVVCAGKTDCATCAGTAGCGWCGASGACQACLGGACTPSGACASGWAPDATNCPGSSGGATHHLFIAYDGSTSSCRSSTDGAFHCLLENTAFPAMAAAWPYGRTTSFGGSAVLTQNCSFHMGTDATISDDSATFQCIENQTHWALGNDDVVLYFPTFGGCNSGRNQWHIPVNNGSASVSVDVGLNFTGANCGCQTAIASHEAYEASAQWNAADCCNGQDGCAAQPPPWGWYTLNGCPSGQSYTVASIEPAGHVTDPSTCTRLTPN